jgi:hypothetical protein
MALAANPSNYLFGKGRIYFKPPGAAAFLDLGNVPKFEVTPAVTKVEHYTSRYGLKIKDLDIITEKKVTATIDIEEFSIDNLNLAFLGDTVVAASQASGNISAQSATMVKGQFVELGKYNVFITKITYSGKTGTGFTIGETVTGGTSTATGKVAWVTSAYIEVIAVAKTFAVGETITGGTSTTTAQVAAADTVEDVVVVNAASSPTTRYALGADYDLDDVSGMVRALTSTITTGYISCDFGAVSLNSVRALANSTCIGQLRFVGDPDQGPHIMIDGWKVNITVSGAVGFISDAVAQIPLSCDFLADMQNHPSNPFFQVTTVE